MEFKQSDTVAILQVTSFNTEQKTPVSKDVIFMTTPNPPLFPNRFQGLSLIPKHWRTISFIHCLYTLLQRAASCQAKCPRSCNDLRYLGLEIVSTFLKYKWRKWNLIFHSMQFRGFCSLDNGLFKLNNVKTHNRFNLRPILD
jgi:hypothetical protein